MAWLADDLHKAVVFRAEDLRRAMPLREVEVRAVVAEWQRKISEVEALLETRWRRFVGTISSVTDVTDPDSMARIEAEFAHWEAVNLEAQRVIIEWRVVVRRLMDNVRPPLPILPVFSILVLLLCIFVSILFAH